MKIIYFDRVDVSESIDVNKTSTSKECTSCHYWYLQIKGLSFNWMSAMGVMRY